MDYKTPWSKEFSNENPTVQNQQTTQKNNKIESRRAPKHNAQNRE